ncbi:MAG: HAMP domain-containing protein [Spirochaetia bacterium]|jgi:signal transduction histidine kinase|nr:HAMP domain-containing protein [Spirochaetia bacterium]
MKITTKIILSIVLIVFVTGTILVAFSANTQKRLIEEQIVKKGSVLAEIISVSSIIPILNYDYSSVKLYFEALSKDSDVLTGELLDNNYVIKMHTDLDRLGEVNNPGIIDEELKNTFVKKNIGADNLIKYEFYSPVLVEQDQIGIFHITLTSKSYLNVIKLVWVKMILLGIMSLLVAVLLAFFLGIQISRPIKELVKGAESVSGGNFKWDFVTNSNDEVGKLARAFRNMTERLDKNITSRIRNEKMAVIGQLSSVLAHEIRNPLEPIKGSAELLKIYYPEEKQIMNFAGIIQE